MVRTYQVYNFWTMSAMDSRELVSSIEFVEICFVSNKAGEVKQEKDVLEVKSRFSSRISCLFDTSRNILLFCQSCWQGFR